MRRESTWTNNEARRSMIFGPPRREREKENPLERRTERAFPLEKPVREREEDEEKGEKFDG